MRCRVLDRDRVARACVRQNSAGWVGRKEVQRGNGQCCRSLPIVNVQGHNETVAENQPKSGRIGRVDGSAGIGKGRNKILDTGRDNVYCVPSGIKEVEFELVQAVCASERNRRRQRGGGELRICQIERWIGKRPVADRREFRRYLEKVCYRADGLRSQFVRLSHQVGTHEMVEVAENVASERLK